MCFMERIMRKVIVNFSGGKDSTVAILEALKRYPKEEITLCYQDTGAEYLETEGHVRKIADILELPLVIIHGLRNFWDNARFRGFFPTPNCRECTTHLKSDAFKKWFNSIKGELDEAVIVFGKRREESLSRAALDEWSTHERLNTIKLQPQIWNPLVDMKEQEVFERVRVEGLPLHLCYDFSPRCSCWCCIFQHPNVVRTYAEMHPDLYERACLLEDEIKHKWKHHLGFNDLMKQGRLL